MQKKMKKYTMEKKRKDGESHLEKKAGHKYKRNTEEKTKEKQTAAGMSEELEEIKEDRER